MTKVYAPEVFELSIEDAALVAESLFIYLKQNPGKISPTVDTDERPRLEHIREEIALWYRDHGAGMIAKEA